MPKTPECVGTDKFKLGDGLPLGFFCFSCPIAQLVRVDKQSGKRIRITASLPSTNTSECRALQRGRS
jgi:hypothetical protein